MPLSPVPLPARVRRAQGSNQDMAAGGDRGARLDLELGPRDRDATFTLTFAAFGVTLEVAANRPEPVAWVRSRLGVLLPGAVAVEAGRPVDHRFMVEVGADGLVSLGCDGEAIGSHPSSIVALNYLAMRIKLTVAEWAPAHVFVHAGVVAIGAGAILLPAASVQGKTTLVRELVRHGGIYYSDDFAVIDRQGLVSPFAKPLSVRPDDGEFRQVDQPVEALGGVAGELPVRVDAVLFTQYSRGASWRPQAISRGQALLALMPHTLSLRVAAERSLAVLGEVVARAERWQSPRGEAREVVEWIIRRR